MRVGVVRTVPGVRIGAEPRSGGLRSEGPRTGLPRTGVLRTGCRTGMMAPARHSIG